MPGQAKPPVDTHEAPTSPAWAPLATETAGGEAATSASGYQFEFSSVLPPEYLEELQELVFFNPQQPGTRDGIMHSVSQYGLPRVTVDDQLRLEIGELKGVQTLYALLDTGDGFELAGFTSFFRTDRQNVHILHIAVAERFSAAGAAADALLALRLVNLVRDAARRLAGVRSVTLSYSAAGAPVRLPTT